MNNRTTAIAAAMTVVMTTALMTGSQTGSQASAATDAATDASNRVVTSPLTRFEQQKIIWHDCPTSDADRVGKELHVVNAQCAEVAVPLDYTKPDGRELKIAIARRTATDRAHRLGTLLLNTGGPSASQEGVQMVAQGNKKSAQIAARYDLIGMDPRFVGRSTLLECDWPETVVSNAGLIGTDRRSFNQNAAANKDLAARCAKHKDLLPHASTRNVARDMDVVRAVLGEQKISYLGWSYGGYLGAVYTQMFPQRVNHVVLDSGLDPDTYGANWARENGPAMMAAVRKWAPWAAQYDAYFHLGTSTKEVLAAVEVVRRAADQGRTLHVGKEKINANEARTLYMYDDTDGSYSWFSGEMGTYYQAARGRKVTATRYPYPYGSTEDFEASATRAIWCADGIDSRDPEAYYRDIQAHLTTDPLFGPMYRGVSPCTFWPAEPAEPPTKVRNNLPALIVSAKGDPITPYAGQEALHRALTGSRMITLNGAYRHAVYIFDENTCIDNAVNDYLLNGYLPTTDTTCERPR